MTRHIIPELKAPTASRGDAITAAAWASYLLAVHRSDDAARVLKSNERAALLLKPAVMRVTKADAAPGMSTTVGFGDELIQSTVRGFFSSIEPLSAAARIVAMGESVPLGAMESINFPITDTTPSSALFVEEGSPIGVRSFAFDSDTLGPTRKVATIVALSRELWRHGVAGRTIFNRMLREVAAHSLDLAIFGDQAASAAACAGLRAGLVGIGGNGDPEADLVGLLNAVSTLGGGGDVIVIANPAEANVLKIRLPLMTVPVLASRATPTGTILAIDPTCFASSVSDVEIFASEESIVHMSDEALPIVSGVPVTADPTRSAYQTAVIMLRLIIDISFIARAGRVAVMEGVSWT